MKKVFHIVSNSWTSGLEKVVMNICQMVPGIDFTYVAPSGEIIEDLKKRNIKYIEVDNITPATVKNIINKNDVDVLHGHDVKASLCIALNYFICRKKKIKIISELHNDDERMHRISFRSLIYAVSSFSYDKVVLVSGKVLSNYKFKNVIKNKSIVIDNVINPLIVSEIKKDDVFNSDFLFIGRLEYQKNPFLFIDFIRLIKDYAPEVKAYMIGKGSLKSVIKEKINKYDLENNIEMLGYQSNPYNYIKQTKAVVITSRYEGLCLVALESLVIGTPVITTNVTGVKQLITPDCGMKSNDLNDLVFYGKKIISDENFRYNAHQGAIDRSKTVNNVEKFIDNYKKLY